MNRNERIRAEKELELINIQLQLDDADEPEAKSGEISVPDAYRQSVSFEDAGITKEEISYVEDVNKRELNQLEGKSTPYESYGNISMQSMAETATRVFGGEQLPGNFVSPFEKLKSESIKRRINAAEAGIHTGEGVGWGTQAIASLALTDQDKANASKKYLNEKFGQDVKIGRDKQSGEMVYFDPKEKKLYPLNRLGMDGGDFAEVVGPLIVGTLEAAGGIYGALDKRKKGFGTFENRVFTARQKKEITYAAAGAGLGEFIRLTLGQAFDVNEDLSFADKVNAAGKEAGLVLGTGIAFEGVVNFVKRLREGLGTTVIPNEVLKQLTDSIGKIDFGKKLAGEDAVKVINEALYEAESQSMLKPLLGQLDDNTQLLDIVAGLKSPGSMEKNIIVGQQELNTQAQREYLDLINNEVSDVTPQGMTQIAEDIKGVTDVTLAQRRGEAFAPLNQASKISRAVDKKLQTTPPMEAALSAKEAMGSEQKVFYDAASESYDRLARDAANLGAEPDSFNVAHSLSILNKTESKAKGIKRISDYLGDEVFDTNTKWTITSITDTINDLQVLKRSVDNGHVTADRGMLKKSISILNKFKTEALKDNPELALRQKQLDIAYGEGKEIFDTGTVQSILTDKNPLPDSQIFDRVIVNGDSTTSKNVATAILGNREFPEAMLKMKQGIYGFYKDQVMDNGIVNLDKHNEFVKNYIDKKIITPFFKDKELNQLRSVGSIGKVVEIETKRKKASLARINGVDGSKGIFEKEIKNLEGKTLFNRVWGEEKQEKVKQLKKALESNPDVWNSYQAEVLNQIKLTIMPDGVFKADALNTLIAKRGGTLVETFGEGYLKNLNTLKESLDITSREGTGFSLNQSNALMDMARAYVGVFTTPGRFLTATNRLRGTAAKKLITDIITDPEKIKKLHALRNARSGSSTATLLFAELGASELAITGEPEDKFYIKSISEQVSWIKNQKKEAEKRKKLVKKQNNAKRIAELKEQQRKYQAYSR